MWILLQKVFAIEVQEAENPRKGENLFCKFADSVVMRQVWFHIHTRSYYNDLLIVANVVSITVNEIY